MTNKTNNQQIKSQFDFILKMLSTKSEHGLALHACGNEQNSYHKGYSDGLNEATELVKVLQTQINILNGK